MKKTISVLLALVMLISVAAGLSQSAYADSQRSVSLNAGKGTVGSTSIELNEDGTLPELPDPIRTGWEFVGWYTDAVEENYWGDNEGEDGIEALKGAYGKYFSGLSDAELKEMLFSWIIVTDGEKVSAGDKLDEEVTALYAKYEPTTVTVTWHLNSWHKEDGIALTAYPQYDSPITALDLTNGKYACNEKDCHSFDGWYDAAEGGNEWNFTGYNGCSTQTLTGDLALYAHWSGGKETDKIQITPANLSAMHPGETFTVNVSYSGVNDKEVNEPVIRWTSDEALELVSADGLTAEFKVSESIDVINSNKLLTVTATTANGVSDSKDITVRHIWSGEKIEKDTCTEMVKSYTCSYDGCSAVRLVSVPNYGEHTVVTDEAVEPTCTETGKTEGSHCSVCGEIIVPQETVDMIPHSFGEWEEKDGEKTRSCNVCGYTETVTVEPEEPGDQPPTEEDPAIEATDATYVIGSGSGVSIHFSAPIEELTGVYVNGEKVDEANYTLSEDGTVLTFTSEYLDSLGEGAYEVTLLAASGSVSAELTVEDADEETTTQKPAEDSTQPEQPTQKPAEKPTQPEQTTQDEQTTQADETTAKDKSDKDNASTSPSTGAEKGTLILAAIALAGGAIFIAKKKEQE